MGDPFNDPCVRHLYKLSTLISFTFLLSLLQVNTPLAYMESFESKRLENGKELT